MKFEGTKNYIATEDLKVAVNAAITLERPIIVKGEPGTGKTTYIRHLTGLVKKEIIFLPNNYDINVELDQAVYGDNIKLKLKVENVREN